jgi:hypothetical protein
MSEKLRPEQRKIWRRIYLTAFDAGSTPRESERMADEAIEQWEKRGAFDEEANPSPPKHHIAPPLCGVFPGDERDAFLRLKDKRLSDDVAVAIHENEDSFALIAMSPRGDWLVRFALANGFSAMLKVSLESSVGLIPSMPPLVP